MNFDLIKKYYELSNNYPSLCFKFKLKDENYKILDEFILGIVTNDGPIYFKLDYSLYNNFNVRELYESDIFSSYTNGNVESLNNLNLENVSYFNIKGDELYYYFGNTKEVIIPDEVRIIRSYCFDSNDQIKYVKGNNVEEIYHYAFKNNNNLEKLEFRKIITMLNLINVPNLKEIVVGNSLSRIDIEDTISENLKFIVNNHPYVFDGNLDKTFFEQASIIKEEEEEISLAMIKGNDKRFRFIKEDNRDRYDECFVGICKFERLFDKLPQSLKQILQNYNYTFYILKNFIYAGMCRHNNEVLIFDAVGIDTCFFHEVGHAIDFCLEKISSSDMFKNIYNEEKDFLYSDTNNHKMLFLHTKFLEHVIESEEEFFAECFQRYFEKDNDFYRECPKAYNFINDLINQLNNNLDSTIVNQQFGFKR